MRRDTRYFPIVPKNQNRKSMGIDAIGSDRFSWTLCSELLVLFEINLIIAGNQIPKNLIRPLVLPVAQTPSSSRDTLASALALTSPEINVHSACCVSVK